MDPHFENNKFILNKCKKEVITLMILDGKPMLMWYELLTPKIVLMIELLHHTHP